jgi:hypothetical protein
MTTHYIRHAKKRKAATLPSGLAKKLESLYLYSAYDFSFRKVRKIRDDFAIWSYGGVDQDQAIRDWLENNSLTYSQSKSMAIDSA